MCAIDIDDEPAIGPTAEYQQADQLLLPPPAAPIAESPGTLPQPSAAYAGLTPGSVG